jgi:hypothetical protein
MPQKEQIHGLSLNACRNGFNPEAAIPQAEVGARFDMASSSE